MINKLIFYLHVYIVCFGRMWGFFYITLFPLIVDAFVGSGSDWQLQAALFNCLSTCKNLCLEDIVSQINQVCRCVCVCVCARETTRKRKNFFNQMHYPFCYGFFCISFDCALVCFYLFLSPSPKK